MYRPGGIKPRSPPTQGWLKSSAENRDPPRGRWIAGLWVTNRFLCGGRASYGAAYTAAAAAPVRGPATDITIQKKLIGIRTTSPGQIRVIWSAGTFSSLALPLRRI